MATKPPYGKQSATHANRDLVKCPLSYQEVISIDRYFLRTIETGSLKRSGSNRRADRRKATYPNSSTKWFTQNWRCAKCSLDNQTVRLLLEAATAGSWASKFNVSLYDFFCESLIGGNFVMWVTRKFIKMSSQFCNSFTTRRSDFGRRLVYRKP